jgi:nickel-dependent lactate racemase
MKIRLAYGREGVTIEAPAGTLVLRPRHAPGLRDEAAAFRRAVRRPRGCGPLRGIARRGDRVAVVIPDGTRPFPSSRVLPWLLDEIGTRAASVTVVIGSGSHRPATPAEAAELVGARAAAACRIVSHDAGDRASLALAGRLRNGRPVYMNRAYVEADRRIVMGFIEPHFMAGFSGGYKAVLPGIVDIASILDYHSAGIVGHPASTWGVLDGNPTQERLREGGALLPVDFCVNVTLDRARRITRFFCGDVTAAHTAGCRDAARGAMAPCRERSPIVVTTNAGYPLDQNLYQTVKGISAAARVVEPGGLIVAVSECRAGFPDHGNFRKLLTEHDSPAALLETIGRPGFRLEDQWEAQLLALVQARVRVALYSSMPARAVREANLEPIGDLQAFIAREMRRRPGARLTVLPEGPMTIPLLR